MREALIVGSPNSGKSLLFNRLTGLNQKVANFPGITMDISSGSLVSNSELRVVDFPGVYSLQPISKEEKIAIDQFKQALQRENVNHVICIVDSTRLEKGLFFALQVIRESQLQHKPVIIAANMADTLKKYSMDLDVEGLSHALGVPVLPLSAKTKEGLETLHKKLNQKSPSQIAKEGSPDFSKKDDSELGAIAHQLAKKFGSKGDLLIQAQNRMDSIFLHSWWGGIAFLFIMYLLFQSIFSWAAPVMDAVESTVTWISSWVLPVIQNRGVHDFVNYAIFDGIGSFLVFVPQIFVLTLVVGILEDTGYLARAAVICHRPLRIFGLTGKSFIPMLSGVACAIPGIYAARTIDSPRKRWLTYFAIPLMPCSARLPVYALLIAAFIPAHKALGGLVGFQGLALFGIYFFGVFSGLIVTALLSKSRTDLRSDLPFVLEMPPYRWPSWLPLFRNSWNRSKHFVTKAGPIIFAVTVGVWFLGYFPNYGADLGKSWLGVLGHWIEPIFQPLGLDWKYGIAILTSFLAREVFVGTLGTLFGIEGADENTIMLAEQIQKSGLGLNSGVALLVFFALALQCVSTLAILQKETGSLKLPVQMFLAYSLLAYAAAWVAFQIL